MARVLVGMSGGVDSSVAAKVLLDEGYDVVGVTIETFSDNGKMPEDINDAEKVAKMLGIEYFKLDLRKEFKECVIGNFIESYIAGKTPNPCLECNRYIKFGQMLEKAEEMGFDYIATGHYALTGFDEEKGRFILKRPEDRSKDQTYVLYSLTQHQLGKTLFPLAKYEKSRIREMAEQAGFVNSDKPDSQDICFVPDGKYAEFIKKYTDKGSEEGDFTDIDGNFLGRHKGIINYTIGQRKGLGIALGKPVFVVSKDPQSGTVVLGSNDDLFTNELTAEDVNFISMASLDNEMRVTAKTRYNQKDEPAFIIPLADGRVRVVFDRPQRAVTSGQAVVFYDGDVVVGGGKIV